MKSTVEYKDIGMEINVKPLIRVNGIERLEIFQKTERQGETVKVNGNEMPSALKSEAMGASKNLAQRGPGPEWPRKFKR